MSKAKSIVLVVREKCEKLADDMVAELGLDTADMSDIADFLEERFQEGDLSFPD